MLRIALIIVLAVLSLDHVIGQMPEHLLVGKVVNEADGRPIRGATVRSADSRVTTLTNNHGVFELRVPAPTIRLIISSIGFTNAEVRYELPRVDTVVVRLSPGTSEIEEVVISTGYEEFV